jgi:alpha-D-xyloside xylohydrolase
MQNSVWITDMAKRFKSRFVFAIAIFQLIATVTNSSAQRKDIDDVDPGGSAASSISRASVSANNPVLPPKWAFGVLYACYWDQEKVLDAAKRLRRDYCGDLLWIDSSWLWRDYNKADRYICFRFDEGQFSDPKAMVKSLRNDHFHFGVWEWPYVDVSIADIYQYGESNRFFITDQAGGKGKVVNGGGWHGVTFTGQIDFTNPKAVEWWKSLNQPLLDMGVDFFKIDTYSTVAKGGVTFDGSGSENLRRLSHKSYFEMTVKASGGRGC